MSQHEGLAARAVYDHEVDEPHLGGRRAVADWGVGEEMFDHLPRRRFRGADAGRRRERRGGLEPVADEPRARRLEPVADAPRPSRTEPAPAEERRIRHLEPVRDELTVSEVEPTVDEPRPETVPVAIAPPPEGRRTVVIRGRGAEGQWTPRRPRAPRTVGERIGPRPDRLAAWAVALGMLLILIAILTAHG
jgi:hypothetical protein